MLMTMKLEFSILLTGLALAVAVPATTWARIPGDFTDDTALTATSPSIVDAIDLMIWNHFKFSSNPNGHLVGDEDLDGTVDGFDFIFWNSNKYTNDGGGTAGCDAATTPCVTDAEYLTAFTTAPRNIPDASGSASAPIFTATNSFRDLNVAIPPGTLLDAFTVVTPNEATAFGARFAPVAYYNGREQWSEISGTPWGASDSGFVASFPAGSLEPNSKVFWQAGGGVGLTTIIPEPSSALILLMALCVVLPVIRRF